RRGPPGTRPAPPRSCAAPPRSAAAACPWGEAPSRARRSPRSSSCERRPRPRPTQGVARRPADVYPDPVKTLRAALVAVLVAVSSLSLAACEKPVLDKEVAALTKEDLEKAIKDLGWKNSGTTWSDGKE